MVSNDLTVNGSITFTDPVEGVETMANVTTRLRAQESQPQYVGSIPISTSIIQVGAVPYWIPADNCSLNDPCGLFFNFSIFSNYVTSSKQLYARFCVQFTDGGTTQQVMFRITSYTGQPPFTVKDTISLGSCWCASSLKHNGCGNWHPVSTFDCGPLWGDTCQLEMMHGGGFGITLFQSWLEIQVA